MNIRTFFSIFGIGSALLVTPSIVFAAPDIPLVDPTPDQLAQLKKVQDDVIGEIVGMAAPTATELLDAVAAYDAALIMVNGTQITGTIPADVDIPAKLGGPVLTLARDWHYSKNSDSLTKAMNGIWLAIDQNQARVWYYTREINQAMALLCNDAEGPAGDALRGFIQTYFDEMWTFDPQLGKGDTDFIYTGMLPLLTMAVSCGDDAHRLQQMRLLKDYLERVLEFSPGTSDFIKVDGTTFHHWTHYPGYMYALHVLLRNGLIRMQGTEFQINAEAYLRFRDTALAYLLYTSGYSPGYTTSDTPGYMSNSLCGRHPFSTANPFEQQDYHDLAVTVGGEILGMGVDAQVAKFYNWMWPGEAPDLATYPAEQPKGFWQFNYGAFGIYRGGRGESFATLKGFNTMALGTEIYPGENRFGRYQSYGTLEIAYPGNWYSNGYVPDGWDWNQPPGTTTIHLPWDALAAKTDYQPENTISRFTGALSFPRHPEGLLGIEGDVGIFAMDFEQQTSTPAENKGFRFKKSVMAFDGMLLALGSNINDRDQQNPTRTNLFQRQVDMTMGSNMQTAIIDGMTEASFPYEHVLDTGKTHWVMDSRNTGYFFAADNDPIHVLGRTQTAPTQANDGTMGTDDFGVAWIEHGTEPTEKGYEFVVVPATNASEMEEIATAPDLYRVHQRDKSAHIVEFPKTMTWAYAIFEAGMQPSTGPVISTTAPCLIMARQTTDSMLLSLANPDLGISYRALTPSRLKAMTVGIRGKWQMPTDLPPGVTLEPPDPAASSDELYLTFETVNGLPLDIELSRESPEDVDDSTASDCGCRTIGAPAGPSALPLALAMLLGVMVRRRRALS